MSNDLIEFIGELTGAGLVFTILMPTLVRTMNEQRRKRNLPALSGFWRTYMLWCGPVLLVIAIALLIAGMLSH